MIDGFMIVSKEEAKQKMAEIEELKKTILASDDTHAAFEQQLKTNMDVKNLTHYKNEKKSKETSKKLIDIAKEVGYQDNNIFGIICLEKEKTIDQHKIQNILFPRLE